MPHLSTAPPSCFDASEFSRQCRDGQAGQVDRFRAGGLLAVVRQLPGVFLYGADRLLNPMKFWPVNRWMDGSSLVFGIRRRQLPALAEARSDVFDYVEGFHNPPMQCKIEVQE